MAVIDFKKIPLYDVQTDGVPVININPSGVAYNPTWGYVKVQQSMSFEYNAAGKYISNATFTIEGVFTINAESGEIVSPSGVYSGNVYTDLDESSFNLLKAKYNALVSYFETAALSEPPVAFENYGTSLDQRLVELPSPLVDANNNPVYARPLSINVTETVWPSLISYTATLVEADVPTGKVVINGHMIDESTIQIKAKKPRLQFQNFAFANGEDIYFDGWETRSYTVNGVFPEIPPSGALATVEIKDFINDLMDGKVTIGKQIGSQYTDLYTNLFLDSSSVSIKKNPDGRGSDINLTAKE